ncbi:MAG: hypothetical protein M3R02_14455 [Chloroflexota bacterium]|nr:hypothetical protein [Chloroflexota bacterium]
MTSLPKTGSGAVSVTGQSLMEAGFALVLAAGLALGGVRLAPHRHRA